MTFVGVRSELAHGRFSDRLVCALLIELANRLEGDRLEVLFLLRLTERVLKNDLPLEESPVFTKRGGRELQNAAV
jgi:hypothetical protein